MNLRDTSLAWLRDERGESGVGLLIVAPAIGLLIAIAVMGGRIGAAQTSIESAAGVAAHTADAAATRSTASAVLTVVVCVSLIGSSWSSDARAARMRRRQRCRGVRLPLNSPSA